MNDKYALNGCFCIDFLKGIVCGEKPCNGAVVAGGVDAETRAELVAQGRVDDDDVIVGLEQLAARVRPFLQLSACRNKDG